MSATLIPDFLASDEELSASLDQSALPATEPEATPSPTQEPSAPAPAERAAPAARTDASPASTGDSPSPTIDAERERILGGADASPARTTHPKSWQGSEDEWQAFRAEQNTRANKERDAREAAQREVAQREDYIAFLKAQLVARDQKVQTDAPDYAEQFLSAAERSGNQEYWRVKAEREAEAARVAAEQQQQQTYQSAAEREVNAFRLALFNERLGTVQDYAYERGVAGLDLRKDLENQFATPTIAPIVEASRTHPDPAIAQALTDQAYGLAIANVKAAVDAARAAKDAAVTAAEARQTNGTAAGRATALGSSSGGANGLIDDFSDEALIASADAYYKAKGWGKVDTTAA